MCALLCDSPLIGSRATEMDGRDGSNFAPKRNRECHSRFTAMMTADYRYSEHRALRPFQNQLGLLLSCQQHLACCAWSRSSTHFLPSSLPSFLSFIHSSTRINKMTLLGSFQMGTSSNPAEPSTMNMSLGTFDRQSQTHTHTHTHLSVCEAMTF